MPARSRCGSWTLACCAAAALAACSSAGTPDGGAASGGSSGTGTGSGSSTSSGSSGGSTGRASSAASSGASSTGGSSGGRSSSPPGSSGGTSGGASTGSTRAATSTGGSTGGTGGAAVPQLVQHDSSSSSRNNDFGAPYCYDFQLPNGTLAGNAVIVGYTFDSNPTATVTDDQGDSYAIVESYYDSVHTQSVGLAAAFNVKANARNLSLCFSADPGGYVQPMATELANVTGVDGAGVGASGTGTAAAAGSLTPTAAGDLVYQVAISLSLGQYSFAAGGAGWTLLSADVADGWAGQCAVVGSGAVDPTITLGSSDSWVSAAILLKAGQSGGVGSGLHIVHLVHENLPTNTPAGGTGQPFPNPTSLQLPCNGNLLVAMIGGGNGPQTVSGITDSNGNGWTQAGAGYAGGDATVQAFYAANATCTQDLSLTVSWGATDGDYTIFFYDVAGAASAPFDQVAGGSGSQSAAGSLTVPYTLTPTVANEIVFSEVMWDYNTGAGLTGQLFDTNTFSGESQSGPEPVDENNGWGHALTSGTSALSFTWTVLFSNLPVGAWAGLSVSFEAAP